MRRVCKKVDIYDIGLITQAVLECFAPAKKRRRTDTIKLFRQVLNISNRQAKHALKYKTHVYDEGIDKIAHLFQQRLLTNNLQLKPIRQEKRIDPSSKKERVISILSIEQLICDHIAVVGLKELFSRVGEYQVSAIKGRGVHYGSRAIQKWLKDKTCKYAVKLDIKNFYGSINKGHLLGWLLRHVKNQPLIVLIAKLINTFPEGLPIGSFLSQTLANIYLSDLYHLAKERCIKIRNGKNGIKKTHQVKHALFYMDDLLLLSNNKRELKKATNVIITKTKELKLTIKPNWNIFKICKQHPVDMIGFRFYSNHTAIRKPLFRSIRRAFIRIMRKVRQHKKLAQQICTRLASYYGYILFNDRCSISKQKRNQIFLTTFNTLRNYANNTLQ